MEESFLLLMDANAWLNLVSALPDTELFDGLSKLVKEKRVRILVPDILLKEWNKKKEVEIAKIKTKFEEVIRASARSGHLKNYRDTTIQEAVRCVKQIDHWFADGHRCPLTSEVQLEVSNRQLAGLAPFHDGKTKTFHDALLFFSTLAECRKSGMQRFVFITYDTDFEYPKNSNALHPDLVSPDIQIEYHKNIGSGLGKFARAPGTSSSYSEDFSDYVKLYEVVSDITGLHLIDQLEAVCEAIKKQAPIVPANMLSRVYPFKTGKAKKTYTYASSFGLHSNNQDLLDMLATVTVVNATTVTFSDHELIKGVEDPEGKILKVYSWLNNNLVFSLYGVEGHENISVEVPENPSEPGVELEVFTLELNSALQNLWQQNTGTISEWVSRAYYHAYFGNFCESMRLFDRAMSADEMSSLPVLQFICLFNIKQIMHLSRTYTLDIPSEVKELIGKYQGRTLDQQLEASFDAAPFEKDMIKYINEKSFIYDAFEKVVEHTELVRDHYYSQLHGGWSSNSNVRNLISWFARLEAYLDLDHVIFKAYNDFSKLFDRFLDGLMLSASMEKKQSSRLVHFDDYLLLRIIYYADTSRWFKFLKRYDLRVMYYEAVNREEERAPGIILKFWKQQPGFIEKGTAHVESDGLYFWSRYEKIAANTLTVLALCDFDQKVYRQFGKLLLDCLRTDQIIRRIDLVQLSNVIRDKGHLMGLEELREIVSIVFKTPSLHDAHLFSAFADLRKDRVTQLQIEDGAAVKEVILKFYGGSDERVEVHNGQILFHCFTLMTDPLKKILVKEIEERLDLNFDVELYYLFVINRMIGHQRYFQQYLDTFVPVKKELPRARTFGRSEISSPDLSKLLNIVFSGLVALPDNFIQKMKGHSDYYDWLLDMDHFDYSKFDPCWILEYPTESYLKKIFGHPLVSTQIRKYINGHRHPVIADYYVKYAMPDRPA